MSKQHLHRYCDEFSFRWDERKVTDGQRTVEAIKGAEGKRLMYRQPVKKESPEPAVDDKGEQPIL